MQGNLLLHRRVSDSAFQLVVGDPALQDADAQVTDVVEPAWKGGYQGEDELLSSAYREALEKALVRGRKIVVFPSRSMGNSGFPLERAAHLSVSTIKEFLQEGNVSAEVSLVIFSAEDGAVYDRVARKLIDGELMGCYWEFYQDPEKYYLSFLNLNLHASSSEAVRALRPVSEHPDWERDSVHLLDDPDWRSHLCVAASYFFFGQCRESFHEPLWRTVEKGSWVSPQILVVLSQCDPEFADHLEQLVARGVQLSTTGSPLTDHISMGPGNELSRLGKIAAAARGLEGIGVVTLPQSLKDKLKTLAEYDFDRAGEIAKTWYRKVSGLKNYLAKGFEAESEG